jgi:SH3 domain protein
MFVWCEYSSWHIVGGGKVERNKLMIQFQILRTGALVLAMLLANSAAAQTVWVSDVFEVTLRTGPSTSNAIQLMVESGTELEVIEQDEESGYSRVRTNAGTEGWVLSRYLMPEPSAREQLETLTRQLTNATAEGSSMGSQLDAIRGQYTDATRTISTLEREKTTLQTELDQLKKTAANTIAIDRQNKNLQQQLTDAEIAVSVLEQEKEQLVSEANRTWFITGALVLLGGILLGLVLPRMRLQKRSRYDSF